MTHTISTRTYTDFNEFLEKEPLAVKALLTEFDAEGDQLMTSDYNWKTGETTERPMEDMDDLVSMIRECNHNSEEEVSSDYITKTYTMGSEDDNFEFQVVGNSYRKDQSVCDEELENELTVIDLVMKESEDAAKKAAKANADREKWEIFFKGKDLEELKAELITYKFPSKIK
jgi:hypothetical protein